MSEYTIAVTGMVCENCERIVSDAVAAVEGVRSVTADADEDVVTVEGDKGAKAAARQAIHDLGFGLAD